MFYKNRILFIALMMIITAMVLLPNEIAMAEELAQQPTGSIPTVTSTSSGINAVARTDEDQTYVRSGPGYFYDKIGLLLGGQSAPAKGRSEGGDWILIEYPGVENSEGWVYAPNVSLVPPGSLPIVEPPATPTPLYTATIDPTLAAEYQVTSQPTRLPTFTEAPPLAIPTFEAVQLNNTFQGVPYGLIILGLFAGGAILGVFAIFQRR